MRQRKRLEEALATEADLERRSNDIDAYFELAREGENVDAELKREIDELRDQVEELETKTLLSGENDARNAIVTIHPGAGGTESQDWAEMLLRMYLRWAERQRLRSGAERLPGGRGSGHQVGHLQRLRRLRLRPADQRDRRAPAGAHLALRPAGAAAHQLRQRLRLAGNRREHSGRYQAR